VALAKLPGVVRYPSTSAVTMRIRLATSGISGLQLVNRRQRGWGIDHLPTAANLPESIFGGRISDGDVADGFEPVRDLASDLPVAEPFDQGGGHVLGMGRGRGGDEVGHGDMQRMVEQVDEVGDLGVFGMGLGIDDIPEGIGLRWRGLGVEGREVVATQIGGDMLGAAAGVPLIQLRPVVAGKVLLGEIRPGQIVPAVVGGERLSVRWFVVMMTPQTLKTEYSRRFFSSTRSTSGGLAV
jgi:hypothetical protein